MERRTHCLQGRNQWIGCFCLLLMVAVSFLLTACSTDETAKPAGQGRVFDGTFQLYVPMGETDPRTVGAKYFAELVEEYSKGRLHCEVMIGMTLGSDVDLIKKVMQDTGEVDLFIASEAYFAEYTSAARVEIPSMPYILTDFDMAWDFADSDLMARFEQYLPKENLRVLAHFCGGFRCLTNSKKPVEVPEDLQGMVIRTPSGSQVMDMFFSLGAKAMPLPFNELYDALKKGYYDGQENPPSIIYNNKIYETQKYLSVTNHCYMLQAFTIAESIWQQLSGPDREILLKAAKDAESYERKLVREETDTCIKLLAEEGMEINYPDLERFREATEEFRRERSEEHYKTDYDEVMQWVERYKGKADK